MTFQRTANDWINAHQADLTLTSGLNDNAPTRRTLAYMHSVSQPWFPGNLHGQDRESCVRSNEDDQWRFVGNGDIDVTTYLKSRIGCCDDYAHMLVWLLQHEGIHSRLVVAGGHTFVEAWLRGAWRMVDANTNAYVDHAFAQFSRPNGQLRVMLANHPATVAAHPLYRPHWTLDRWRLLSTLMEGGFTAQLRELPPHPFPATPNGEARPAS